MNLPDQVFISAVSVAELHAGVREGSERVALGALLSTLDVVNLTAAMASHGGLLRRDFGRSHGVGLNDALIAATAHVMGLEVVTLNTKHYPSLGKAQLRQAYAKDSPILPPCTAPSSPHP